MQKLASVFSICFLFSSGLQASQMIPLTVEELSRHSELILRGTVASKSCQRDSSGGIYTQVELEVAEVWKGVSTNKLFTIVHGGGILGDRRVVVSGQVSFQPGEEVVAFLVLNQRGEGVTLGMAQGKFHVWTDERTQQKYAHNPFHGSEPGRTGASPQHSPDRPALTLTELKQRVRGAAQ